MGTRHLKLENKTGDEEPLAGCHFPVSIFRFPDLGDPGPQGIRESVERKKGAKCKGGQGLCRVAHDGTRGS